MNITKTIEKLDTDFGRNHDALAQERQQTVVEMMAVDQIAEPGRYEALKVKATKLRNEMNDTRRHYEITRRQLKRYSSP